MWVSGSSQGQLLKNQQQGIFRDIIFSTETYIYRNDIN